MLYNLINKEDYEYDLSVRDVHTVSRDRWQTIRFEKPHADLNVQFFISLKAKRNSESDIEDESDDYAELDTLLTQLAYINLGKYFGAKKYSLEFGKVESSSNCFRGRKGQQLVAVHG